MNPLYKILSISVISVICANEMVAKSGGIWCELLFWRIGNPQTNGANFLERQ